jgi:hypothetical protein
VQRLTGGRWRTADTDLGLRILWRVDDDKPKLFGVPLLALRADRDRCRARDEDTRASRAAVHVMTASAGGSAGPSAFTHGGWLGRDPAEQRTLALGASPCSPSPPPRLARSASRSGPPR